MAGSATSRSCRVTKVYPSRLKRTARFPTAAQFNVLHITPANKIRGGKFPGVESVIRHLHVLGFAEVGEWSLPLPSPIEGEVVRILTRYYQG
ncbi:MAG: hypothetical protein D6728_20555 [Cyanobacteria bacterium J055]|nr:MAG: hypothetical protein D6728_20555 [Cyanobacteria bacterium J055]